MIDNAFKVDQVGVENAKKEIILWWTMSFKVILLGWKITKRRSFGWIMPFKAILLEWTMLMGGDPMDSAFKGDPIKLDNAYVRQSCLIY